MRLPVLFLVCLMTGFSPRLARAIGVFQKDKLVEDIHVIKQVQVENQPPYMRKLGSGFLVTGMMLAPPTLLAQALNWLSSALVDLLSMKSRLEPFTNLQGEGAFLQNLKKIRISPQIIVYLRYASLLGVACAVIGVSLRAMYPLAPPQLPIDIPLEPAQVKAYFQLSEPEMWAVATEDARYAALTHQIAQVVRHTEQALPSRSLP